MEVQTAPEYDAETSAFAEGFCDVLYNKASQAQVPQSSTLL